PPPQSHPNDPPSSPPHRMAGDGATIKSRIRNLLLRSPSAKQRKSRESLGRQVTLEKVLGITASGNSGLTCDPRSGLVAYPAGCVVVLLNPKKKRQHHIINTSRKTITSLSFSPDGKYLVTGESGHLPAVRLWDVEERRQVAELHEHKYGVSCVAFSPNSKFIVSVGNQHDMMVTVWVWKKDVVVAANKVSSKVTGVSFSEDSSYFVTAGNRHVKFWYLDHCLASKASAPVPLLGRSGLLGELRNNFFCDVACGRGSTSDSTFCITSSGLLCEFNGERMLDKWVDLRRRVDLVQTSAAQSLSLSEDTIFCGCADGTVRAFSSADLHFACTLPRPHPLGTDVAAVTEPGHLFSAKACGRYPDVVAVTFDPVSQWLSCVYDDHSLYVWDVSDVNRVGKVHSALFHAASVGDLEMFPDVPGESGLSTGAFLSCSADNTIRLWRSDDRTRAPFRSRNILSSDLLNIIYVDGNTGALQDPECWTNMNADKQGDGQTAESRTGIRTICVSPDGRHLASGDRSGTLRVHDLRSLAEILKVESHDAEILCLQFSKPETGVKLLATAGRDRLIHVLDAEDDYALLQTLDEHSATVTAVRFAATDNKVRLISCGADKSIYFRTALKTERGTEFRRSHHMVRKSTPCDMDVDPTCKYAAVGCQDRCINCRVFNISSGKQKKIYKGSLSEDGSLLKVTVASIISPRRFSLITSGQYVATSCSDKNISILFHTGECVATMDGHSEIVTGMKFTNDCQHLISVSGDSCIFVWRLAPELTARMSERLSELLQHPNAPPCRAAGLRWRSEGVSRREAHDAPTPGGPSSDSDLEREEDGAEDDDPEDAAADASSDSSSSSRGEEDAVQVLTMWEFKTRSHRASVTQDPPDSSKRPRRRWSHRMAPLELMVKSMLDLRQLETFAPKKRPRERQSTSSLQEAARASGGATTETCCTPRRASATRVSRAGKSPAQRTCFHSGNKRAFLFSVSVRPRPSLSPHPLSHFSYASDYTVKEQRCRTRASRRESKESRSPDSARSLGYGSRDSSPERPPRAHDCADVESLSPGSSDEEPDEGEEDERGAEVTSLDRALRTVTETADDGEEDFLKHNFETPNESCSTGPPMQTTLIGLSVSLSSSLLFATASYFPPCFSSPALDVCPQPSRAAKAPGKEPCSRSAKPPVSKVRPLMEDNRSGNPADRVPVSPGRVEGPKNKCPLVCSSPALHSPVTSSDRREPRRRPQQLSLFHDAPHPSFHFSSPSNGSSQSPDSPLPWESPKLRPHSYMNPTASSMAKSSRSTSLGDVIQPGSPPCSPLFHRGRRSSVEPEVEPPSLSSRPALSSPPRTPPRPPAAVSPSPNRPPSRIPLPKQQLSPRRSLCLEEMASSQVRLPCSTCPSLPSPPSVTGPSPSVIKRVSLGPPTRRTWVSPQSLQGLSLSLSLPADPSITLETCRQAVTELRNSLKKTAMFYSTVLQSDRRLGEDQQEMRSILSEALVAVKAELDSLPHPARVDPGVKGEGENTRALLEQYAELLLRSVERRLESKT
uniref:Mitogen-activated protein kinase binding protein 1 n=1 Tax=Gasterosteus aculeatus TaxID=69293 RepID=G3PG79_GASAC